MSISQSPPSSTQPLHTVLIGTSLGAESDAVVRAGLAVARASKGKVYLIHAAPAQHPLGRYPEGAALTEIQGEIDAREASLRQQIERLGIQPEELAGADVHTGAPYRILVETARKLRAGLIVIGAAGAGPVAAELLGSTADRVLRKALAPVLVVRGELAVPLHRVLAPVDLSTLSADAFRCGLGVLCQIAAPDLQVKTLYAVGLLETLAARKDESFEEAARRAESAAREELRRFVLENRPEVPVHLETAVVRGEARQEILDELGKSPADLILLGTHGRGGLDRLVLGSVAATIARKAPCSVLMVSPDAAMAEGIAEAVATHFAPAFH
ncbi:MAG TPA: universal stress protein [Thermoanaerobaculia bacterium]|nr:universal stress protein [Thermoanaerobaculia bacterium]